ncbi:MAG: tetratricopeptide repeat protein [Betaproteobacteria bacterium]|nr:tetratricopeptide repeat protein [Betaproteobacteria bacterium]MBV9361542.1 tetratricopeptide repeat protein [Betaproteobacteria bacterium]
MNLGIGLEALGDLGGAIASYERALESEPADPFANYNFGKLLYGRGELARASELLARALQSRADFPEARIVLALIHLSRGKHTHAATELEAALRQRPDDFGALFHYAATLRALNRLAEARDVLKRVIAIDKRNADAHAALSDVLAALGDSAGATAALEAVLAQRPDWADALFNYGTLLRRQLRLEEAERAFRRAIAAQPGHAGAYRMLGEVLLAQSRGEEAFEVYRKARQENPQDFGLESAELFALFGSDRVSDEELFARHAAFGKRLEAAHPPRISFRNARDPGRRLRIGYLSGDFRYHVVTLFMLPVLERHDRASFEVYCYSTGDSTDAYTRQIAQRADVWRPVAGQSSAQIAEAITRDEIDILVDLSGHSGTLQLATTAERPAPVQATWLGYLNTTGLTRIHYRITDRFADPPGVTERYHTESLVRLPHGQWCYRPFLSPPVAAEPPSAKKGFVTFGAFHQAPKISGSARRLWAQILAEVPDSRLLVVGVARGRAQEQLLRDLTGPRVSRERITCVPYAALEDYLRLFSEVDIALDSLPFSGGTTSCDTLWMGVPIVTLPGTRSVSRSASSVVSNVGLTDWIASSPEDYVRRAVRFAGERKLLADLRSSLRNRMSTSPLMDEAGFVRDLEQAYREMWRKWCAGEPA